MHCAIDIDRQTHNTFADIDQGLDRARDDRVAIELYAHSPGRSVPVATLEHVFAGAAERGLRFVTYRELATEAVPGAAIAFSFDDAWVEQWWEIREVLQRYAARVTFFVSRYATLDDEERAQLQVLAADGHDVEAHSVNHLRAPAYVETNGVAAYLTNEVLPSAEILRRDGYDPIVYAYPFGQRTSEIDDAALEHFAILRSVSFAWSGVQSPCPD
ncbi:MAG: polysaccharide deacetylase family protein [Proteobacteria bacterium]|nr:polysaccharide deacetylase family protein [Pseudomonadota bacterium]